MEKGYKSYWWLISLVILLAGANIFVFSKIFLIADASQLPQLKFNAFSAGSFVLQKNSKISTNFSETRNILVLGRSGGNHIAPELTDTILIAHINGPLKKVKIISIPRDLAVKTGNYITKINGLYKIGSEKGESAGLKLIQNKVEEVTGIKTDSFILFDLDTVEKVIDEVGGLNVYVKEDIKDTSFPTDNGGYETFSLKKGLRYLDGKTALKFVRTRNSARGDFDRMEHQQAVLKAVKGKVLSLNPVWDFAKLWKIFNMVQQNVKTDLTLSDLKNIWAFSKNLDLDKLETFSLNPENGLIKSEKMKFGVQTAYVLTATPKQFDYANIQKAITSFLGN